MMEHGVSHRLVISNGRKIFRNFYKEQLKEQ